MFVLARACAWWDDRQRIYHHHDGEASEGELRDERNLPLYQRNSKHADKSLVGRDDDLSVMHPVCGPVEEVVGCEREHLHEDTRRDYLQEDRIVARMRRQPHLAALG